MNFSQDTIDIIRNFNQITQTGMRFPKGTHLTVHDSLTNNNNGLTNVTTVAIAELQQALEEEFLVYDPVQFFSALATFDSPFVEIEGQEIIVRDSESVKYGSFRFAMASPDIIGSSISPANFPEDAEDNVQLHLSADAINQLFKAVGVVLAPYIMFKGEGGDLLCRGFDKENPTADQYNMPIGITDQQFEIPVRVESINKLMKGVDYDVTLTQRGIVRFVGDYNGNRLSYYFTASV